MRRTLWWRGHPPWLPMLLLVATALRAWRLDRPGHLYWDENFYVADACTYVHHSISLCGGYVEASAVHPPLGKWLIAWSIEVFGYHPLGWRLVPVVLGVLTVGVTYLIGSRLFGTTGGLLAGAILALDPMHLVFSRLGTLDVPVTAFATVAVYFALRTAQAGGVSSRLGWQLGTGIALGAALATKWSGVLVVPVVIALVWPRGPRPADRSDRPWVAGRTGQWLVAAVELVAVPAVIYVSSYAGRLHDDPHVAPWRYAGWARVLLRRQEFMARFHLGLDGRLGDHPYESPAWSWPLAKRPPVLSFDVHGRSVAEVLGLVDPIVVVPGLVIGLVALVVSVRHRFAVGAPTVVGLSTALGWLPWVAVTSGRRSFVFAYYIVPVLPFTALALAWAVVLLARRSSRAAVGAGVLIVLVSVTVLAWWWPVLTGASIPYQEYRSRMVFDGCGGEPSHLSDGRIGPSPRGGPPPPGWCWI